jgi:ABC-type dipeptide/oligopeptide/nickel transport system ATPase subunit
VLRCNWTLFLIVGWLVVGWLLVGCWLVVVVAMMLDQNKNRMSAQETRRTQSESLQQQQATHKESVARWVALINQFRAVIQDPKLSLNVRYYVTVLDDRLKAIAEFKGEDRKARKLMDLLRLEPEDAITAGLNTGTKK